MKILKLFEPWLLDDKEDSLAFPWCNYFASSYFEEDIENVVLDKKFQASRRDEHKLTSLCEGENTK